MGCVRHGWPAGTSDSGWNGRRGGRSRSMRGINATAVRTGAGVSWVRATHHDDAADANGLLQATKEDAVDLAAVGAKPARIGKVAPTAPWAGPPSGPRIRRAVHAPSGVSRWAHLPGSWRARGAYRKKVPSARSVYTARNTASVLGAASAGGSTPWSVDRGPGRHAFVYTARVRLAGPGPEIGGGAARPYSARGRCGGPARAPPPARAGP